MWSRNTQPLPGSIAEAAQRIERLLAREAQRRAGMPDRLRSAEPAPAEPGRVSADAMARGGFRQAVPVTTSRAIEADLGAANVGRSEEEAAAAEAAASAMLAAELHPIIGNGDGSWWNYSQNRPATNEEILPYIAPLLRPYAYLETGRNLHTGEPVETIGDRIAALGAIFVDGLLGGALPKAATADRVAAVAPKASSGAEAVLQLRKADQIERAAALGVSAKPKRAAAPYLEVLRAIAAKRAKKLRRFFYDDRAWRTVQKELSKARGGMKGDSYHHWLFPQRQKAIPRGILNAGFNRMIIPQYFNRFLSETHQRMGGVNEWMGLTRRYNPKARLVEQGIRVGIPTTVGATGYGAYELGRELLEEDNRQRLDKRLEPYRAKVRRSGPR